MTQTQQVSKGNSMQAKVSVNPELTSKQRLLITLLVSGSSILDAAKSVGVSEKTVHAWKKQPAFIAAYQEAREQADKEVWSNAMQQLKNSLPQALEVLAKHASYVPLRSPLEWGGGSMVLASLLP